MRIILQVHIQLARARGATVLDECPVLKIEPTAEGGAKVRILLGGGVARASSHDPESIYK